MAKHFKLPNHINKLYVNGSAIYLLHSTPITVILMAHVYIIRSLLCDGVHYANIVNDIERYFENLERSFLEEKEFNSKLRLVQGIFIQRMAN